MRKLRQNDKDKIFLRDNFTCKYCGGLAEVVDHIIPYSYLQEDGDNGNLVSSCALCNGIVSDKIFDSFESKKKFILNKRKRKKIQRRFNRNICPDCKRSFRPGNSKLLCDECYEFWTE